MKNEIFLLKKKHYKEIEEQKFEKKKIEEEWKSKREDWKKLEDDYQKKIKELEEEIKKLEEELENSIDNEEIEKRINRKEAIINLLRNQIEQQKRRIEMEKQARLQSVPNTVAFNQKELSPKQLNDTVVEFVNSFKITEKEIEDLMLSLSKLSKNVEDEFINSYQLQNSDIFDKHFQKFSDGMEKLTELKKSYSGALDSINLFLENFGFPRTNSPTTTDTPIQKRKEKFLSSFEEYSGILNSFTAYVTSIQQFAANLKNLEKLKEEEAKLSASFNKSKEFLTSKEIEKAKEFIRTKELKIAETKEKIKLTKKELSELTGTPETGKSETQKKIRAKIIQEIERIEKKRSNRFNGREEEITLFGKGDGVLEFIEVDKEYKMYEKIQENEKDDSFIWRCKNLKKENFVSLKFVKATEDNLKHLKNELKVLSNLGDHPLLMKITRVFKTQFKKITKNGKQNENHNDYYVLEFQYFKKTIGEWLKEEKKEVEQVKMIFNQIFQAIAFIHTKGYQHHNISKSSILINTNGPTNRRIGIIDFDHSRNKKINSFISLFYRDNYTSDIYELGLLLYQGLVLPKHSNFISIDHLPNYLPQSAIFLLKKMLKKEDHDMGGLKNEQVEKKNEIFMFELLNSEFFLDDITLSLKREIIDSETKIKMVLSMFQNLESFEREQKIHLDRSKNILDQIISIFDDFEDLQTLLKPFYVTYENETGIDQGGLTDDMFVLFIRQLFDDKKEYFIKEENNTLFLPSDQKDYATTLINFGKILLRSLIDQRSLLLNLHPLIFCSILDKMPTTFNEWLSMSLKYDYEFTKNIEKFLFIEDLDFLQSYSYLIFVKDKKTGKIVEKVIKVNNENKKQFVLYKIKEKLLGKITGYDEDEEKEERLREQNMFYIVAGFFCCLNEDQIAFIRSLNCEELSIILCGKKKIKYEEILEHLTFDRSFETNPAYKITKDWFMQWIKTKDQTNLRKLLLYVSSVPNLPVGIDTSLNIKVVPSEKRIFAHTCATLRSLELYVNCNSYEEFKRMFENTLTQQEYSGMYE